jgi:hypothetical protein
VRARVLPSPPLRARTPFLRMTASTYNVLTQPPAFLYPRFYPYIFIFNKKTKNRTKS